MLGEVKMTENRLTSKGKGSWFKSRKKEKVWAAKSRKTLAEQNTYWCRHQKEETSILRKNQGTRSWGQVIIDW